MKFLLTYDYTDYTCILHIGNIYVANINSALISLEDT